MRQRLKLLTVSGGSVESQFVLVGVQLIHNIPLYFVHACVCACSDYKQLMQHNDWQHDPLQLGSPANGIMSRYDLLSKSPQAFGGIDSKTMDWNMAKSNVVDAMNSPTHVQQPPFKWTPEWASETHMGQPYELDFTYQTMTPYVSQ